jgi:LPS export ABC transporter protein LptC
MVKARRREEAGPPAAKRARGRRRFFRFLLAPAFFCACTFDYGVSSGEGGNRPDMEMDNVEYTRVRDGDPQVRFRAERAERWEKQKSMELEQFSFEQFEDSGETINVQGRAGTASVELDSGNIELRSGVSITVDSEDITIETEGLNWNDGDHTLQGLVEDEVILHRPDGTVFSGRGFAADTRNRTWQFSGAVSGTYVHEDDEDDGDDDSQTASADAAADTTADAPSADADGTAPATDGVTGGVH